MNANSSDSRKRRFLSPEKRYQIFLETQRGDVSAAEVLRREGLYSTDLARIREKVKEGVLERLADRPGTKKKMVSLEQYEALKIKQWFPAPGSIGSGSPIAIGSSTKGAKEHLFAPFFHPFITGICKAYLPTSTLLGMMKNHNPGNYIEPVKRIMSLAQITRSGDILLTAREMYGFWTQSWLYDAIIGRDAATHGAQ